VLAVRAECVSFIGAKAAAVEKFLRDLATSLRMELVEVFRSAMVGLVVESADQELVILEKILLSPHSMRAVAHRPTI
jgi:hypothetical protein